MRNKWQDLVGTIPILLATIGTEELLNIILLALGIMSAIVSITVNVIKVIKNRNLEDLEALKQDVENQIKMLEKLKEKK